MCALHKVASMLELTTMGSRFFSFSAHEQAYFCQLRDAPSNFGGARAQGTYCASEKSRLEHLCSHPFADYPPAAPVFGVVDCWHVLATRHRGWQIRAQSTPFALFFRTVCSSHSLAVPHLCVQRSSEEAVWPCFPSSRANSSIVAIQHLACQCERAQWTHLRGRSSF